MKKPNKETGEDLFVDALIKGPSNAILDQEARGQQSSDTLPTQMSEEARRTLELAGVKFLEVIEGDPLFQYVKLPLGWQKQRADHFMWSYLVDDKGRKRAAIFYKAAFYDRSAHLEVLRRYAYRVDYDKLNDEQISIIEVRDHDESVIYTTDPIKFNKDDDWKVNRKARDKSTKQAKEWLDKNYPDWQDPSAYWD